jgi:hypothetical protein
MARDKIRLKDQTNNSIDSSKVIDGSLTAQDIKRIDNGDSTGINAETLPYEHNSLTPTIKDKIDAIEGVNWTNDSFIMNGVDTSITLSNKINAASPYMLYLNGQLLKDNLDYYIAYSGNPSIIAFDFVPSNEDFVYILYQIGE